MNRAALFWLLVAACASPAGGDDRAPIIAPSAPAVAPVPLNGAKLVVPLFDETAQMARECKAFVRAKKVKTPEHLLRVVLLYCGLDKSLRTVAGTFTALYEPITDQAVGERLRA